MVRKIVLVRHGETEWSRSGAHTGRTDIPLTTAGEARALEIGQLLSGHSFTAVLTSPLQRARRTCSLAGFETTAVVEPNLREWDYGDYEGRTTLDVRKERPGWSLWIEGAPNGETIDAVAARAKAVIDSVSSIEGDVALFAHGHLLRVLAAVWTGWKPIAGRALALSTGSLSTLGFERETRVIERWNQT